MGIEVLCNDCPLLLPKINGSGHCVLDSGVVVKTKGNSYEHYC
jgi:hypothetical protein